MEMIKRNQIFYYKCEKCGTENTSRIPDLESFVIECKTCHHVNCFDKDNIFVRINQVERVARPKQCVGPHFSYFQKNHFSFLLPPPMRLFFSASQKHGLMPWYLTVNNMCEMYSLTNECFTSYFYYWLNDDGYKAAMDKLSILMSYHEPNSEKEIIEKSHFAAKNKEAYLFIHKQIWYAEMDHAVDRTSFFLVDERNKFVLAVDGHSDVLDRIQNFIVEFEFDETLFDKFNLASVTHGG